MSRPSSGLRAALNLVVPALLLAAVLPLVASSAAGAETSRTTRVTGWAAAPEAVQANGTFRAQVDVNGPSRAVTLQRRQGTTWSTVKTTRSSSTGAATLSWPVPLARGRLVLRVRVPRTPSFQAAVTASRTVTVRTVESDPALDAVYALVNEARSTGQTCGDVRFPAVPPLKRNAELDGAAEDFAQLMAEQDFFSHVAPGGADPGDRITEAGYTWSSYGENIAAGYDTPAEVVQGWLDSPGHCEHLMGKFTHLGLGHADNASSTYGTYWVQDFATPL